MKLSNRKTISDSKRLFYNAFPHVISPVYRRIADELLVEIHLLSNQKGFELNTFFAIGFCEAFEAFTKGYKPQEHLIQLFEAICKSNDLDPSVLKDKSKKALEFVGGFKLDQICDWYKDGVDKIPEGISSEIKDIKNIPKNYSRLYVIGLYKTLKSSKDKNDLSIERVKESLDLIVDNISLSKSRVEKDIGLFKSNLEKMNQSIELMKEILESQKKKKGNDSSSQEKSSIISK